MLKGATAILIASIVIVAAAAVAFYFGFIVSNNSLWIHDSEVEIGGSLVVVTVLMVLYYTGRLRIPRALSSTSLFGWGRRKLLAVLTYFRPWSRVLFVLGLAIFIFLAFINISYGMTWFGQAWARSVEHLFHFHFFPGKNWLGLAAFLGLLLATLSLTSLRLDKGLGEGFRTSFLQLASPATLAWMLVLLTFMRYSMIFQVVNFLPWSIGGIYFISNWLVLLVSGFFTAAGFLEIIAGKPLRPASPIRH